MASRQFSAEQLMQRRGKFKRRGIALGVTGLLGLVGAPALLMFGYLDLKISAMSGNPSYWGAIMLPLALIWLFEGLPIAVLGFLFRREARRLRLAAEAMDPSLVRANRTGRTKSN